MAVVGGCLHAYPQVHPSSVLGHLGLGLEDGRKSADTSTFLQPIHHHPSLIHAQPPVPSLPLPLLFSFLDELEA